MKTHLISTIARQTKYSFLGPDFDKTIIRSRDYILSRPIKKYCGCTSRLKSIRYLNILSDALLLTKILNQCRTYALQVKNMMWSFLVLIVLLWPRGNEFKRRHITPYHVPVDPQWRTKQVNEDKPTFHQQQQKDIIIHRSL